MEQKIKKVMGSVFGVAISEISDLTSPDTIGTWDSLQHINFVLALEEELGVSFSDEEVGELVSFPRIVEIVSSKF